ncbi:MAG TPA: glycosyltransferase [Candidatus Nanoarchaeia archaeon]|nr:glycosyltransferase [Candidatus Nanoarchaeia archaeon]
MSEAFDLSIIIPAYKEGPEFGPRLVKLAGWLKEHDYGQIEVVLMMQSDDGSGDREIAAEDAALFDNLKIVNLGQRAGKGAAVRAGIFEASGRYRLFMDADLATPLEHLDDVYRLMQKDAKVIIAVRDLVRIHKGLMRKFMSKFGNLVAQVVLLPGIKDTQCGFKAFEAEAAREIFSRQTMPGWSFDMEVLKIARLQGYKIEQVLANDWHDPKADTQGLVGDSPIKAAVQTFADIFKIRLNVWAGKYKRKSFNYESRTQN